MIIKELDKHKDGLTIFELSDNLGKPQNSIRTNISRMRKANIIKDSGKTKIFNGKIKNPFKIYTLINNILDVNEMFCKFHRLFKKVSEIIMKNDKITVEELFELMNEIYGEEFDFKKLDGLYDEIMSEINNALVFNAKFNISMMENLDKSSKDMGENPK